MGKSVLGGGTDRPAAVTTGNPEERQLPPTVDFAGDCRVVSRERRRVVRLVVRWEHPAVGSGKHSIAYRGPCIDMLNAVFPFCWSLVRVSAFRSFLTWNVPSWLRRAKTPWSCRKGYRGLGALVLLGETGLYGSM